MMFPLLDIKVLSPLDAKIMCVRDQISEQLVLWPSSELAKLHIAPEELQGAPGQLSERGQGRTSLISNQTSGYMCSRLWSLFSQDDYSCRKLTASLSFG